MWLARSALDSLRAVKIVHRAAFESARPYEREFAGIKKFEAVSRSHEALIDILHVGRNDEAGFFFYVMELADPVGPADEASYRPRTLAEDLAGGRRLPVETCLTYFRALASGLQHLHAAGLLHRDIKPSNIVFVRGRPVLADIGLVADVSEARSFVGTEGYIPPEGPGTVRADLFSLGKVFYEAASGRDRTEFPSVPDDIAEMPDHARWLELNAVILKLCADRESDRYADAASLVVDLDRLQRGESVRSRDQAKRRRRTLLTLASAAAVVALAVWLVDLARVSRLGDEFHKLLGAREQLHTNLLAEVRRIRSAAAPDWPFLARDTIAKAAAIRPTLELRNEAFAALNAFGLHELKSFPEAGQPRRKLLADPANDQFVQTEADGSFSVYSLEDTRLRCRISMDPKPIAAFTAFSPDGRQLSLVTEEGAMRLHCTSVGCGKWDFGGLGVNARGVGAYTWDDQLVAYPQEPRRLRIANAADVFKHVDFFCPEDLDHYVWSPDNRRIAVSAKASPRLWLVDPVKGGIAKTISFATTVNCFAWRTNSSALFVAAGRSLLQVTPDGESVTDLLQLDGTPESIHINGDGQLAAVLLPGRLEVWNLATRRRLVSRPAEGTRLDVSRGFERIVTYNAAMTEFHLLETSLPKVVSFQSAVSSATKLESKSSDGRWEIRLKEGLLEIVPSEGGEALVSMVGNDGGFLSRTDSFMALPPSDGYIEVHSLATLLTAFRHLGLVR